MSVRYVLTEANVADQIRAIDVRLKAVCGTLTDSQLNWQPNQGAAWSIGQCVDHVTSTNRLYATALASAIDAAPPAPTTEARPDLLGRGFIWAIEPPVRMRVPAPAVVHPRSSLTRDEVVAGCVHSFEVLQALAQRATRINSSRTRFANPFMRGAHVFNVATGLLVMLAHARRHLGQMEQVRARPDFPSQ
jgi:hypothetical protein